FYAIQNESGQVDKIVVLTEDINERKQTEQELQNSKRILNLITENAFDFIWTLDMEMNIRYATNSSHRLLGYTPEEILKINTSDLYSESEFQKIQTILIQELAKGDPHSGIKFSAKHLRKDGTEFPVEIQAKIIYNKHSEPILIQGYTRDITESTRAEKALKESEQKFRSFTNQSIEGITVADVEGNYTFVNPTFCEMIGYSETELLKMTVFDVKALDQDNASFKWSEVSQEGLPREVLLRRKDGSTFIAEVIGKMIRIGDKKSVLGIIRNITEQKQAEAERKALEAQVRQSQKLEAVGTMVGGIAHDFNNILQSMFLYGETVKEQLPKQNKIRADFQHLLDDTSRAHKLLEQILTFSHKSEIELKAQSIHEIVIEALSFERASFPSNISIEQDIDPDCGKVLCDKVQMHQIVINLCNNAKHAMAGTGGTLKVRLKQIAGADFSHDSDVDVLELVVSDTGQGMDTETLDKIFNPFFTTKAVGEGTGLGLSVIHGIVELMGARIQVVSEVGEGSSFKIFIPVIDAEMFEVVEQPIIPQKSTISRILLVDDEVSIRKAGQVLLTRKGFTVDIAADGQEALEKFKADPDKYDLIVTDLSMPIMSGIELSTEIRKSRSAIAIILSSGNLEGDKQLEYKEIGVTAFIQKPWTGEQLVECIAGLEG
ncbi:MAG: PAS domain S-box protein, partial [Candidatus Marinimicrobia bacterium]|nr:PAS domain S-box protein [Candidatus Neomarinimicrobiota bacterium]